jgi:hypothetical protein
MDGMRNQNAGGTIREGLSGQISDRYAKTAKQEAIARNNSLNIWCKKRSGIIVRLNHCFRAGDELIPH